jgi:hypothetical protein
MQLATAQYRLASETGRKTRVAKKDTDEAAEMLKALAS